MRLRRRGGAKRERLAVAAIEPLSGVFAVRGGDFDCVRIFGAAKTERPDQVHFVVVLVVFGGGDRDCLGDVSVFAVRVAAPPFWRRAC